MNAGIDLEEINLPDIFEYWTLHEDIELIFLRAVPDSRRLQNLYSVFL